MSDKFDPLIETLQSKLGDDFVKFSTRLGELTIEVKKDAIRKALILLRDNAQFNFKQLIDICGADYPQRVPRFEVIYSLLSLRLNHRIRVKVRLDDDESMHSVINVYGGANWYEREVWDMYGIPFEGHPDLRRILSDYTFDGHPLRKDFPLTGYVEVRYDDVAKKVLYEPVNLQQAFRNFDYLSPWEGMTPVLPGDEKATPVQEVEVKEPEKKKGAA